MEVAGIVLHQVIIMFLLLIVGIVLLKRGVITEAATRVFCNLLLIIVVPCTIISSYYQPFSKEKVLQIALSFALAAVFHFIAIFLSRVLIRKGEDERYRMERLGVVYSNCGFMGFPLLSALLGEEGIFLGAGFIALLNIFIWIEGVRTLKDGQKVGIKKALANPGCIGVAIGLVLYFTQIRLPDTVIETVDYLGSMNTPLAMVITGVFLAGVSVKAAVKDVRAMLVALIKTIFIPLIFVGGVALLGVATWFDGARDVCIAIAVCASCPTAASIILIPASMNMDGREGAKLMAISTLFSIVTLPLMSHIIYRLL